ncbi:unnamed protein product [Rotaria magnacalcarata]|uniref:HAT C-terminal dimerisation domain-containing protein n=2 Tax=Rotaria magnacalcarata TaxID=392030 RepID=A0A816ZYR7_9BILA|nr:unnamed protein product [Rotaria magnacalcarata]
MNVLIYWNNNQLVYPTLATIAQRVLCMPVTNTSVERIFSDSGNAITSRRTRLQTSKTFEYGFVFDEWHLVPHFTFAARQRHFFVEHLPLQLHASVGVINPALT